MIHHVQYPVGQGGFHLGIIDNYAYIYDCGGCSLVDWNLIFSDVINILLLNHVKDLDIFVSHLHKDHYNKVSELFSAVNHRAIKVTIYIPQLGDIEKLIIIGEYLQDNDYDDSYISTVVNGRFTFDTFEKIVNSVPLYKHINNKNKDIHIVSSNIILRTYVSNVMKDDVNKFRNELSVRGINIDNIKDRILDKNFWYDIKSAFTAVFKEKNISNKIMLCLYCGKKLSQSCCDFNNSNWLHTGDAYMNEKNLHGFLNRFGVLLNNVNFAQIPHHGSSHNHDETFSMLFNNCHCRTFFYTYDDNSNVVKNITDISICSCQSIREVSDNPLTKISI